MQSNAIVCNSVTHVTLSSQGSVLLDILRIALPEVWLLVSAMLAEPKANKRTSSNWDRCAVSNKNKMMG